MKQAIRLGFPASNNEAEYEVILSELDLVLALFVSKLRVYSDSQLVVRHVQEEYGAKYERMARYLTKIRDTLQRLDEWTIEKIPLADNVRVDTLQECYCPYMCRPIPPSQKHLLAILLRKARKRARSGQKS